MLLDRYYATEAPIPADQAHRICRARTKDEKTSVDNVLSEFFSLSDGAWNNSRCDKEIDRFRESEPDREAKRENAKERQRRARLRRSELFGDLREHGIVPPYETPTRELEALLSRAMSQPVTRDDTANQTPDTRHQSPVEELELTAPNGAVVASKPSTPDCPHAEIVALYHETLPQLRRVRDWTPDRQAFLRARWREKAERQSIAWWKGFFEYVGRCPFLIGQGTTSDDREPFTADLEWLVRPKNFRKVIEGKYQPKQARAA